MTDSDAVGRISAHWGVPCGQAISGLNTCVSAALWRFDAGFIELTGAPDHSVNIISIPVKGRHGARYFGNGRLRFSKVIRPWDLNIAAVGEAPRIIVSAEEPFTYLHIYVPQSLLESASAFGDASVQGGCALVDPCSKRDEPIASIARQLVLEITRDVVLSRLRMDALGLDLAVHLLRSHSATNFSLQRRACARGGLAPWQLKRITDLLEHNLSTDVSLADLAATVDLSTFHLCRAFKQSTGLPPHRWRHQRRMERARDLLEHTDLPVTDIAAQVGYDNPNQLSAAFKKALSISPSQYRRERR